MLYQLSYSPSEVRGIISNNLAVVAEDLFAPSLAPVRQLSGARPRLLRESGRQRHDAAGEMTGKGDRTVSDETVCDIIFNNLHV